MTSAQAARALGMSTSTVLRIPATDLPHWVTPGGHRRYRREHVASYAKRLGRPFNDAGDTTVDGPVGR